MVYDKRIFFLSLSLSLSLWISASSPAHEHTIYAALNERDGLNTLGGTSAVYGPF
jgi:hypothetical protein